MAGGTGKDAICKVMELGTLDGILGCVAAGMGTTMMPRAVVEGNSLRRLLVCHRFPSEKAQRGV